MNSFVRIASIALVTLSAGCGGSNITTPPGPSVPMTRLRPEPYAFSFSSGMNETARIVVRDAATWQATWNQIYLHSSPVPPLPTVDFSQEMIVVVALGNRPTGGYNILLEGASELPASGTLVTVSSVAPGPRCITTQAFTQPVDIARVPLRSGAVSFVEQTHVTNCG
jgi:PrcB C-terminal